MKRYFWVVGVVVFSIAAPLAQGATYYYADWSADTVSTSITDGSASGTISTPEGTVTVNYTGDVVSSTQVNNSGSDYFTNWPAVYTNSTVSNSPTNVDVISLSEARAFTDTLTFSAPLINPILDIVSLGGGAATSYNFNATPVILSQGSAAFGGCGTCLSVNGNSLSGTEGDGVVEFSGAFSSLSWTTTNSEFWNGFTLGVAGEVPEPATWTYLPIALIALALFRRRRR